MHRAVITNSDYQTRKWKNLKKKPNKSTGKESRKMLRIMRKDNIEEDDVDMNTDEEVAEKGNAVKANETKVTCIGIYPEKRNESVNSPLTFLIAELDDFNVRKYFAVYWPKPKAYYRGKLLKVFSAGVLTMMLQKLKSDFLNMCKILLIHLKSNGIGRELRIRALLMLSYVLQVHVPQISLIPDVQNYYICARNKSNGKVL